MEGSEEPQPVAHDKVCAGLRSFVLEADVPKTVSFVYVCHRAVCMAKAIHSVKFEPAMVVQCKGIADGTSFAEKRVHKYLMDMKVDRKAAAAECRMMSINDLVRLSRQLPEIPILTDRKSDCTFSDFDKVPNAFLFPETQRSDEPNKTAYEQIPGDEVSSKTQYVLQEMKDFFHQTTTIDHDAIEQLKWCDLARYLNFYLHVKDSNLKLNRTYFSTAYENGFNFGFTCMRNSAVKFFKSINLQDQIENFSFYIEIGRKPCNGTVLTSHLGEPYSIPFAKETFPPDFQPVKELPASVLPFDFLPTPNPGSIPSSSTNQSTSDNSPLQVPTPNRLLIPHADQSPNDSSSTAAPQTPKPSRSLISYADLSPISDSSTPAPQTPKPSQSLISYADLSPISDSSSPASQPSKPTRLSIPSRDLSKISDPSTPTPRSPTPTARTSSMEPAKKKQKLAFNPMFWEMQMYDPQSQLDSKKSKSSI